MKRIITSFGNLPKAARLQMADQYPHGYTDEDITKIPKGDEYIYTVEVRTEEAIYLVRVDKDIRIAFGDDDYWNREDKKVKNEIVPEGEYDDTDTELA